MNISTPLKSRIFFTVILLAIFLLIFNGRAAAQARTEKQNFNVQGRGTFMFEFALQSVGKVIITANWQGAFPGVLTLKNPVGKVQKQQKGASPIKLEFWVTQQLLKKGGEWKITFYNESSLKTKGIITIAYPPPTFVQPQKGWCCSDGRISPSTREECRKRSGQFFSTREAAERQCRRERPGPEEPKDRPRPEEPEEGWCCKDGRVFPAAEEECRELRGHFFPSREQAEEYCQEERPQPMPEEGWCCKDGRVFPAAEEECRELRGHFFPTREQAEEHCQEERPHPEDHPRPEEPEDRPRPEEIKEGWCCKDGQVFPANLLECCERRGHFFETREQAEEHCREERPRPEEPPHPEGGWCCLDGEVFPAGEAECAERGGQFYVCEEDARRYCPGSEPGPEPGPEIAPPLPPEIRPYPAIPTANLDVEGRVPLDTLEKVANAHAHELWGEEIAPGPPFPVADKKGNVFAFAFHYIRGSQHFPGYEQIFDRVRSIRQEPEVAQMGEQFGYIYVSATDKNFPILLVSHYLHPYFLVGDLAREQANRHFDSDEVRLDKIYFLNPHDEYFEFISHGKSIVFNVNSLEKKPTAAALDVESFAAKTDLHIRKIREAWDRVTQLQPVGTPAEEAAKTHTEKRILHWKRLPPIPHTWWCVPTTEANILGFWDNYARGSGTFLGYGRFIKYWFEHPSYCHLSTGPQADCKWSNAIHNNVPDIIDIIIDPKTGSWRKGFTSLADRVSKLDNYKFSSSALKPAPSASNNWAWKDVKKEVHSGRPAFWSFKAHMVAAIGYRITNSGQKLVITYDSYGVTFSQKIKEYTYDWCNGFRWVIPGGGTNGDHMIIDSPDGGEYLTRMVPYDITWWVWGVSITRSTISFSADGGRTWTIIASDVNTKVGKNTYQWLPDKATQKGRIRIQCYTGKKVLIAADGSQEDFTVKTASLNNWGSWKSLGKPLTGHYGIERLVVGQNQDGRLEVFGIGSDGGLWHNYQTTPNSNSWSGWGNMSKPTGLLLSTAAVGRNQDGRLEVTAIASDGALWHRYQSKPNKGPWIGWGSMGKPSGGVKLVANPVIGQNQDGRLEVFVFGSNGALWHRYQPKPSIGPWSSWSSMGKPSSGGKFYAHPAVTRNKDGRLEVFAMAGTPGTGEFQLSNTSLWHNSQPKPNHKGSWGSWQSMGKPSNASWPCPAAGQNKDGRLEVFVPGSDGALWHKYQSQPNSGSWAPWKTMANPPGGIKVLSQIDAAANKDGRLEVFTFGIRGKGPGSVIAPWHIWQVSPNSGWSQWAGLGAPPGKDFESLTVARNKDGRLEVFAIASDDNSLWHISQN
ncbi:MAG: hypothetical protein PVH61_16685 [Candidatus Aminicenantes bacterium]